MNGNTKNTILVKYIFITFKYEIYKFKWRQIQYKLVFLKTTSKNCMNIELYNDKVNGEEQKVLVKCSPKINDLRNIH